MSRQIALSLTDPERRELRAEVCRLDAPASLRLRARIILMLDEGATYQQVQDKLGLTAVTVAKWKKRYAKHRLSGLMVAQGPPRKLTPQLRSKILCQTMLSPPDGSAPWTLRKMARVFGVGKDLVRQVWREAGLQPYLMEWNRHSDPRREPERLVAYSSSAQAATI